MSNEIAKAAGVMMFFIVLALLGPGCSAAAAEIRIEPRKKAAAKQAHVAPSASANKTDALGSRLLLPFYRVEAGNPNGATTLYAVRNESTAEVDIEIRYFEGDRPQTPQQIESLTLGPKQVTTVNLRDVANLLVEDDGFARGYAIIESSAQVSSLQGDYFQVTTGEGFAQGDRLVNMDSQSQDNDLCRRVTARYLNGAPFSGSTFHFWFESAAPPTVDEPALFYTVYSEDGAAAFDAEIRSDRVAFSIPALDLLSVGPFNAPAFGVIEFEFNQTIGFVSVTMSANGLYSVGIEAVCLDNSGF